MEWDAMESARREVELHALVGGDGACERKQRLRELPQVPAEQPLVACAARAAPEAPAVGREPHARHAAEMAAQDADELPAAVLRVQRHCNHITFTSPIRVCKCKCTGTEAEAGNAMRCSVLHLL